MVHVCAAVICVGGRFLITSRPQGTHLEGRWEFPGGKIHEGESPWECLRREILEELGAEIHPIDRIFTVIHKYPEKEVRLDFYRAVPCDLVNFKITGLDGQRLAWVSSGEFLKYHFVEADVPLVEFLSLA